MIRWVVVTILHHFTKAPKPILITVVHLHEMNCVFLSFGSYLYKFTTVFKVEKTISRNEGKKTHWHAFIWLKAPS